MLNGGRLYLNTASLRSISSAITCATGSTRASGTRSAATLEG
jgi:hypothetical protein